MESSLHCVDMEHCCGVLPTPMDAGVQAVASFLLCRGRGMNCGVASARFVVFSLHASSPHQSVVAHWPLPVVLVSLLQTSSALHQNGTWHTRCIPKGAFL